MTEQLRQGFAWQYPAASLAAVPAKVSVTSIVHKREQTALERPGFLSKDGKAVGPFGVMGGFMQPQGHVQVVVNTVDYHMNPQECLDAPRMQWTGGKRIQLEREVPAHIGLRLAEMGHQVEICNSNLDMGRGQIIWRMEDGTLAGGTEPRCDGTVAAW